MGRESKEAESDEAPGAPEWMVTFSDCMTLLLTFFVLLLSFSSFDDRVFRSLKVVYSRALTSITPLRRSDRDAFLYLPPVRYVAELDEGSEKPTSTHGFEDALMKESEPVDLRSGMTFLISSKKVFWGNGMTLSPEGYRIMDTLALFLKRVPSRIVISENGQINNQDSEYFGLPRALATMEYLVTKQNLDRKRFSISAAGTLAQGEFGNGGPGPGPERAVEIVLLDRNIYN
jgi:chemotaxis protein MotB